MYSVASNQEASRVWACVCMNNNFTFNTTLIVSPRCELLNDAVKINRIQIKTKKKLLNVYKDLWGLRWITFLCYGK